MPLLFSEWPQQFHLLTLNLRACLPPMPHCTITSLLTKVCSQKTWRQNSNLFLIILASSMYNLTMTTHSFGMILMTYRSCSHFHASDGQYAKLPPYGNMTNIMAVKELEYASTSKLYILIIIHAPSPAVILALLKNSDISLRFYLSNKHCTWRTTILQKW